MNNKNEIILKTPYKNSNRDKSWVTIEQVETEHWYFITKITEIMWHGDYSEKSKKFARSVLDFLVSHEFVTWKQFDCVMSMKERKKITAKRVVSFVHHNDIDTLGNIIFGDKYIGEHEEEDDDYLT